MDKSEMIEVISKDRKVAALLVKRILNDILDKIVETVTAGNEDVNFRGFGKFCLAKRKAKKGVNPKTLAPVEIPEAEGVKFRPAKKLRSL